MSITRYALKQATLNQDILLTKQPIVQLTSPSKTGIYRTHYEILTSLSPAIADFYTAGTPGISPIESLIEELEHTQSTLYLDDAVSRELFKWLSSNKDNPIADGLYHINIHPDTLNYDMEKVLPRIKEAIDCGLVKPSQICFEITENCVLQYPEATASMLLSLRKLGCSIALDDFGKKMLSINVLGILRPDYIKIDGSFTQGASSSTPSVAEFNKIAIRSIVNLARAVGACTVSEHIETQEDCELARAMGVDYGQGWYFSKPVSLDTAIDFTQLYDCKSAQECISK